MTHTCDHCDEEIVNGDQLIEIQPAYTKESDGELLRQNMAWLVHERCARDTLETAIDG